MTGRNINFKARKTILDLPLDGSVLSRLAMLLKTEDILNMRMCSWAFRILADKILKERPVLHIGCCEKPIPCPLVVQYCQSLRTIHLSSTSAVTNEMLAVLTTKNPHITEFRVIGCPNITCDGLYSLMQCRKLLHLEISNMVLQNKFFSSFAKNYISLQEVSLKGCYGFLGHSLAKFFLRQRNLRSITLISLLASVLPSLLTIGRSCRQLERIAVFMCKGIDDQGVLCVATSCPELHTFLLSIDDPLKTLFDISPNGNGVLANVSREAMEYLTRKNIITRNQPQKFSELPQLHCESDNFVSDSE